MPIFPPKADETKFICNQYVLIIAFKDIKKIGKMRKVTPFAIALC